MSISVLVLVAVALVAQVSNSASVPVINSVPEELKFLASSRILMDHTSSSSPTSIKQVITKATRQDTASTAKTVIPSESPTDSPKLSKPEKLQKDSQDSLTVYPSLHVARCRANCIENFNTQDANNGPTSTSPDMDTTTSVEEMHLLPILRLKRKKRPSLPSTSLTGQMMKVDKFANKKKSPWSCIQDSSDYFTCWESCKLLEPGKEQEQQEVELGVSIYTTQLAQPQENGKGDEDQTLSSSKLHHEEITGETMTESKSKQSIISCSELILDSTKCTVGCEVACSFYERLFTKDEKQDEGAPQQQNAFTSADPVVATKQESVVKIVPGRITWVREARKGNTEHAWSSLYVVIQEYPDRKWRQIAQTMETELEIPLELTSTMKTKLRSVRVLVVSPEGLLSVIGLEKQEQLSDNNNISREKMLEAVAQNEITTASNVKEMDGRGGPSSQVYETEVTTTSELIADSLVQSIVTKSESVTKSPSSQVTGSSSSTVVTTSTEDNLFDGDRMEEEPFELRRVSLIHQKSLVIAELQWNEIGDNPSQEYLITWELTGGGLKGHLVTDSTSVTLSLWPSTAYQIQVELFEQNLDGDGEQPAVESSSVSLKSLPLTVDTSEASFPLESPSALLGNNDEEEEEYEEDEFEQEGNEMEEVEEEDTAHKSITEFLNMPLVLGISVTALILVLVILTLAAFTWTRTRCISRSEVGHVSGKGGGSCCYEVCFSDSTEPELLISQDEGFYDSNIMPVRFCDVDLSKSNTEKTSSNSFSNSIVPSTVYTTSSSSAGGIPNSTSFYCNECTSHLHTSSLFSSSPKFSNHQPQSYEEVNEIQCAAMFS